MTDNPQANGTDLSQASERRARERGVAAPNDDSQGLTAGPTAEDEWLGGESRDAFLPLPRAALHAGLVGGSITGAILSVVFLVGAGMLFWRLDDHRPLVLLGLAIAFLFVLWTSFGSPFLRWRTTRYLATDEGLEIRRGWLWKRWELVPASRIQHSDVTRGPIERLFGLSTLVVYTAGTHNASTRLSGLVDEEAHALRERLTHQDRNTDDGV